MHAKKTRRRTWQLILLVLVVTGALVGSAVGKYRRSFTLEGAQVTFSAKLATEITLREHKAVRLPDGSYDLDPDNTVANMTYHLIPGLDIPKDPHITVTGKTPIDSYLFAEVVDTTPNEAIGYEMTGDWKALGITGKNGGSVYVYTGGGADPRVVDESMGDGFTLYLLQDNRITVGQTLLSGDEENTLQFYACMGEAAYSALTDPMEKAADVYKQMNGLA